MIVRNTPSARSSVAAILMTCAVIPSAVAATSERALAWSVTPYVWFTDTSYELRADGEDIGTGTIDFGELYETLDSAFQLVVETGREGGRWKGIRMAQAALRGPSAVSAGMASWSVIKEAEFEDDGLEEEYEYKGPVVGFNFGY